MLNKIQIGRYYDTESLLHQMNSVIKLVSFFLYMIAIFISNSLLLDSILVLALFILLVISNIPIKQYFISIFSLRYLLFGIILIDYLFGVSIDTIIHVIIQMITIVLYSQLFLMTSSIREIMYSINCLLSPLKKFNIPIHSISFSLSLALCFIPMTIEEASKIMKSLASRGIDYRTSFKNKIVVLQATIIPMFYLTMRRADLLAEALEVRHYNIEVGENNYDICNLRGKDISFFLIHISLLIIVIGGRICAT